jgi:hypothetical protein
MTRSLLVTTVTLLNAPPADSIMKKPAAKRITA